jgi:hypothetical protein
MSGKVATLCIRNTSEKNQDWLQTPLTTQQSGIMSMKIEKLLDMWTGG